MANAAPGAGKADPLRHTHDHEHLHGAFGADAFGRRAEMVARFFGTPQYIVGQSIAVAIWIMVNAAVIALRWDPYPFILLNLAFSTQAAYAAPLILLAQTRQADRDKASELSGAKHAEELSARELELLREIERLTKVIHDRVVDKQG